MNLQNFMEKLWMDLNMHLLIPFAMNFWSILCKGKKTVHIWGIIVLCSFRNPLRTLEYTLKRGGRGRCVPGKRNECQESWKMHLRFTCCSPAYGIFRVWETSLVAFLLQLTFAGWLGHSTLPSFMVFLPSKTQRHPTLHSPHPPYHLANSCGFFKSQLPHHLLLRT